MKFGRPIIWLLLAVGALAVSGCGSAVKEGGTVETGLYGGDPGVIAFDIGTTDAAQVSVNLFDGLTESDSDSGRTVPKVADTWEHNDDLTVWTFKLKRDYKFCNGETVTSESFKAGWEATTDPDLQSSVTYLFTGVKGTDDAGNATKLSGVTTPDKYILKVELKEGDNIFDKKVSHPAFQPIPVSYYKKNKKSFPTKPVGNGPFCVTSYKSDRAISTRANSHYKGTDRTEPKIDKLVFRIYADEDASYKAFRAGSVLASEVPNSKREQADALPGTEFVKRTLLGTYYYGFKVNEEPWKGEKGKLLRQAVSYAIDRENIVENIWGGAARVADGFVPPGVPGYQSGASPYNFDPEKAKELLKKAGYPGGEGLGELTLGYNTGSGHEEVAASVQSDLAKVGVKMKPKGFADFVGAFIPQIEAGKIPFFRLGWVADYNAQENFLYPNFSSETIPDGNVNHYRNKKFDELLNSAAEQTDSDESDKLYREAEKILFEDPPIVSLFYYKSSRIIDSDKLGGYERTPEDTTPYEKVFLK